jgi:uncharacterized protein (TIGR04222 family)
MHPWGLSGPEFLWLYAAGLVVGLAVAIGVRMAVRRPRLAEPSGALTPEELGFLAGGPKHAVGVAIARLMQSDLVRIDRSGKVTATSEGRRTGRPFDDAVLAELTGSRKVDAVAKKLAGDRLVTEMGESLVSQGLLVRPARSIRTRRFGPVVLYVVFAVGVVRWINGIANDLPTGYLTWLLAATFGAILLFNNRITASPTARSVHGDRVVAEVREKRKKAPSLEQIAVSGMLAYPDRELASALAIGAVFLGAPTWSYLSAGSFDSHWGSLSLGSSGDSNHTYTATSSSSDSSGGGGCGGGTS